MTGANRKNPEPRHLAERYTLRRRVLSAKFTRAGDRHLAHAHGDEEDTPTPVGASGSSPGASVGDLPVAPTGEMDDAPESTQEEAQL